MLLNKKGALDVTVVHCVLVNAECRCKGISHTFEIFFIARLATVLKRSLTVANTARYPPPSVLFAWDLASFVVKFDT